MRNYSHLNIKDWAEEDRPREKLRLKGKPALSEAELIAIIIGSGTSSVNAVDVAKRVLNSVENDLNKLARLSINDLKKFEGIGEAKAISIVAAMELGRRRKDMGTIKKPRMMCSNDVYKLMHHELMDLPHEELWSILLNKRNTVIKKQLVSSGGVSGTVADVKIIFKAAVEELASGVILAHNHPSGNPKPSRQDIQLTQKMKEAGKTLDIPLLDHLIFTDNGYFSFIDENML